MVMSEPDANRRLLGSVDHVLAIALRVDLNVTISVTVERLAHFKLSHMEFFNWNRRFHWHRELESTVFTHHLQVKPLVVISKVAFVIIFLLLLSGLSQLQYFVHISNSLIIILKETAATNAPCLTKPWMSSAIPIIGKKKT